MLYKRILLKLSGEYFRQSKTGGLDFAATKKIVQEIVQAFKLGAEIAVVVGAGNIFRGRNKPEWFDRVAADNIGIVATYPNAMALVETINHFGVSAHLMSALALGGISREIDAFRARKLLEKNNIIVFAGGTGNAYVTTDTAAVLRALEIQADALLKGTTVDGVYSADPNKDTDAKKYSRLTYSQVLKSSLGVMDMTAFALARDNNLPIVIFKWEKGSLCRLLKGEKMGTVVK